MLTGNLAGAPRSASGAATASGREVGETDAQFDNVYKAAYAGFKEVTLKRVADSPHFICGTCRNGLKRK